MEHLNTVITLIISTLIAVGGIGVFLIKLKNGKITEAKVRIIAIDEFDKRFASFEKRVDEGFARIHKRIDEYVDELKRAK